MTEQVPESLQRAVERERLRREKRKEIVRNASLPPVRVSPRDPWLEAHKVKVGEGPNPKGRVN